MQNLELPPIGKMRIYGCGGFGVNVVGAWNDADAHVGVGTAEVHLAYIDTSRSNLPDKVTPQQFFLLEGVDGSGKVRAENHVEISRNIKSIIQQFAPGDMNLVVFSASGGSGSVFGPLLMAELMEQGHQVAGIVVGSDESTIAANNTLKTLKSLESIAGLKNTPAVISYHHNRPDVKRSTIDADCRYVMSCMAMLASRRNRGLDTRDLRNWLNFPAVTSVEPQLALLTMYNTLAEAQDANQPVSVASLYRTPDDAKLDVTAEYVTDGYPREAVESFDQLHGVISLGGVPVINRMLTDRIASITKANESRVQRDSLLSSKDQPASNGLVL